MDKGELEKLSIEHIRIYESFEKKEKCALCRCIEDFENQVLNAISTDLVMDLEFFPKFGEQYTFCDYHMSKMEDMRDKLGMAIMLKKLITLEIRKMERVINGMNLLNNEILKDEINLGKGFEIGHSYFTPSEEVSNEDEWYERILKAEIEPLLREYWFDNFQKVGELIEQLR